MTKGCELCSEAARMHCESDGANLCWDCDIKVHSANFLVAKHSRSLLCHLCQSPTPWIASGTNLGRTFSICISCSTNHNNNNHRHNTSNTALSQPQSQPQGEFNHSDDRSNDSEEESSEDDGDYIEDEEDEDDEDGENQVVPLSSSASPPSSSSTEEELSSSRLSLEVEDGYGSSLKRRRQDTDVSSEDETECSSSSTFHRSQGYEGSNSWLRSLRPPAKLIRQETAMVNSFESTIPTDDNKTSTTIFGLYKNEPHLVDKAFPPQLTSELS